MRQFCLACGFSMFLSVPFRPFVWAFCCFQAPLRQAENSDVDTPGTCLEESPVWVSGTTAPTGEAEPNIVVRSGSQLYIVGTCWHIVKAKRDKGLLWKPKTHGKDIKDCRFDNTFHDIFNKIQRSFFGKIGAPSWTSTRVAWCSSTESFVAPCQIVAPWFKSDSLETTKVPQRQLRWPFHSDQ